jgi:hypothetical protein
MQMPQKDVEIAVVQSRIVKVVERGDDEMAEGHVPVGRGVEGSHLRRRVAYGEGMTAKER